MTVESNEHTPKNENSWSVYVYWVRLASIKVGRSKPGAILTGRNRPGQYSQSGQYWYIEILSGRLNIFSGQLEIMAVSWLFQVQMLFLQVAS